MGEELGEWSLERLDLDGENERDWSEMKPCLIIAETSLDFSAFSAAIGARNPVIRVLLGFSRKAEIERNEKWVLWRIGDSEVGIQSVKERSKLF